ncbi:MarR family winged helix-turn-helix transcriptional regulator [Hyalangium versicolor]|uniref:MarR family winged helix-turn-helix transcriptional regulator n=1 Tax=Hyalangium versicolor TaxID=2861190 RepID=UPI001CC93824|nr:helix-turn-helix domain-containing protein [Hyalangium versicolor]
MKAPPPPPTLGTLLRHLVETLDDAVEQAYARAGLDYRPRYTPVVRALMALGPTSIRAISQSAEMTHSAVSQTVSQMATRGLVRLQPGEDARERIVVLTPEAETMVPALERQWAATNAAAAALEGELSAPLSQVLREAIAALERRPFSDRITEAAAKLERSTRKVR